MAGLSTSKLSRRFYILAGACAAGGFTLGIPGHAVAEIVYDGANSSTADQPYIDGGDWFNGLNWDSGAASPPVNGAPTNSGTSEINAATQFINANDGTLVINSTPVTDEVQTSGGGTALGVVYDPVGFGGSDPTGNQQIATLYLASASSKIGSTQYPQVMTINSGSLEATAATSVIDGRSATGDIVQNGGSFYGDGVVQLGQFDSTVGLGIYTFNGGTFKAGITPAGVGATASSSGLRLGSLSSGSVGAGIMQIHNGGKSGGQITLDNLYLGYTSGGVGILNYYYENNSGVNGMANNVSTINVTGGNAPGSQGQIALRNYAAGAAATFGSGVAGSGGTIGSVLNLNLTAAPTVINGSVQNLALATYTDGVHANSTDDPLFYNTSGKEYTEGSTVSAVYGGTTYNWEIYYDGSITGGYENANYTSVASDIPSSAISQTGGEAGTFFGSNETTGDGAIVLIGQPVPEPAVMSLLVVGGVTLLGQRRRKGGQSAA